MPGDNSCWKGEEEITIVENFENENEKDNKKDKVNNILTNLISANKKLVTQLQSLF